MVSAITSSIDSIRVPSEVAVAKKTTKVKSARESIGWKVLKIMTVALAIFSAPTPVQSALTCQDLCHQQGYVGAGRLTQNQNDYESVFKKYGSYRLNENPYDLQSIRNPYALDTPRLYDAKGKYLGKLSSNNYDFESISNPYGKYGNVFSSDSLFYGEPIGNHLYGEPRRTHHKPDDLFNSGLCLCVKR